MAHGGSKMTLRPMANRHHPGRAPAARRGAAGPAVCGQPPRLLDEREDRRALQRERVKQPAEDPRESGPVARIATAPLKVRAADVEEEEKGPGVGEVPEACFTRGFVQY